MNVNRFFTSNAPKWRLFRTIIQGVIGVLIANIDVIAGTFHMDPAVKAIVVALIMAVLSPIMASLGTHEMDKPELPEDFYEGEGGDQDANGD